MIIKALALDPGRCTGYCYATIEGRDVLIEPGERMLSCAEMYDLLLDFVERNYGLRKELIYEDFQFRQGVRTGLDLTPAKLIGVFELFCERYSETVGRYVQQPSVQGSGYWSNDRLKEYGVYWAHGKGHARSATKHMLHWIKFGAGAQYVKDPIYTMRR